MATTKLTIDDLAHIQNHSVSMLLYPPAWQGTNTASLIWHQIDFPSSPNPLPKSPGVYVFAVKPDIFGINWAGSLFYVGKAKSLYNRIYKYIEEIDKDLLTSDRPLVWKMVNRWNGHLKFCYTITATVELAKNLETEMLEAYRPPFNTAYEATTSHVMRAF